MEKESAHGLVRDSAAMYRLATSLRAHPSPTPSRSSIAMFLIVVLIPLFIVLALLGSVIGLILIRRRREQLINRPWLRQCEAREEIFSPNAVAAFVLAPMVFDLVEIDPAIAAFATNM